MVGVSIAALLFSSAAADRGTRASRGRSEGRGQLCRRTGGIARSSGPSGQQGSLSASSTTSALLSDLLFAARSRDFDLVDACHGRALGDVERQERKCLRLGRGFDRPPDRVLARAAGGERRPSAQSALMPFERGEDGAAFMRLVAMV